MNEAEPARTLFIFGLFNRRASKNILQAAALAATIHGAQAADSHTSPTTEPKFWSGSGISEQDRLNDQNRANETYQKRVAEEMRALKQLRRTLDALFKHISENIIPLRQGVQALVNAKHRETKRMQDEIAMLEVWPQDILRNLHAPVSPALDAEQLRHTMLGRLQQAVTSATRLGQVQNRVGRRLEMLRAPLMTRGT